MPSKGNATIGNPEGVNCNLGRTMKIRLTAIASAVALLAAYCFAYLYLRHIHYFIHRAGSYADPRGNNYIELGQFVDGPELFVAASFGAMGDDGELNNERLEAHLEQLKEQVEKEHAKRLLVFHCFATLIFVETLFWQLTDPNPLHR